MVRAGVEQTRVEVSAGGAAELGAAREPLLFRAAGAVALAPVYALAFGASAALWAGTLQGIADALDDPPVILAARSVMILALAVLAALGTSLWVAIARSARRAWRAPRSPEPRTELAVALAFSVVAIPEALACGVLVQALVQALSGGESPLPLLVSPGLAAALTFQGGLTALLIAARWSRDA